MKTITKKEAVKLFNKNKEVYVLYPDNTEALVEHQETFELLSAKDGIKYGKESK